MWNCPILPAFIEIVLPLYVSCKVAHCLVVFFYCQCLDMVYKAVIVPLFVIVIPTILTITIVNDTWKLSQTCYHDMWNVNFVVCVTKANNFRWDSAIYKEMMRSDALATYEIAYVAVHLNRIMSPKILYKNICLDVILNGAKILLKPMYDWCDILMAIYDNLDIFIKQLHFPVVVQIVPAFNIVHKVCHCFIVTVYF